MSTPSPRRRPRRSRPEGSDPNLALLAFMAEHRLIFAAHAAALLGVSVRTARDRLAALADTGHARRGPQDLGLPHPHQITPAGLRRINSRLTGPERPAPGRSRHDDGLAWLWLAAHTGAWGPLREVISERTMRSHDARLEGFGRRDDHDVPGRALADSPYGVRLYTFGVDGRERRHYPDLLLVTPTGQRVAVELELSTKEPARREAILAAYDGDPSIAGVLYLVENPATGRAMEASARRVGLRTPLSIQRVEWPARRSRGGAGRSVRRSRGHQHPGPDASRPDAEAGR